MQRYFVVTLVVISTFLGCIIGSLCNNLIWNESQASEQARVLDLEQLRIVDKSGKPRILLAVDGNEASVILFDENQKREPA